MLKNKGIATRQFFILTFGLTIGTSILVTPIGLARVAREDAWMASLCSLAINLVMVLMYIGLTRLYPGRSLYEINEAVLGKWLGKALTVLYLYYALVLCGTMVGDLGFFMTSEMMPETPIETIQLIFVVAVVMCARLGVIVLARFGELMFPWVLFFFLILVLTLIPQVQWNHIKPVLDDGWPPVLKAGLSAAMFQELVVMLSFFSLLKHKKNGGQAFIWGTVTGGLVLTTIVLLSILVLGIEQTENSTFPAYALAKTINVGNFLQRVEGILITIWVLTFFIKVSLVFISILQGFQSLFGLKSQSHLIYPLAVLAIVIAWNTYINTVYVNDMIRRVWSPYSVLHLLVIPLILYLIGLVRRKLPLGERN